MLDQSDTSLLNQDKLVRQILLDLGNKALHLSVSENWTIMIARVTGYKHSKGQCKSKLEISYHTIKKEKLLADPCTCSLTLSKLIMDLSLSWTSLQQYISRMIVLSTTLWVILQIKYSYWDLKTRNCKRSSWSNEGPNLFSLRGRNQQTQFIHQRDQTCQRLKNPAQTLLCLLTNQK